MHCSAPIQVDPEKYRNMFQALRLTASEEGVRALARGWAPTLIGYSMQGLCKFGFYEVFKIFYANVLGEVLSSLPLFHYLVLYSAPLPPSLLTGEDLHLSNFPLPGSQCQCRVLCRHCTLSHGGCEGQSADWHWMGTHPQRVCPEALQRRGHQWVRVLHDPPITCAGGHWSLCVVA